MQKYEEIKDYLKTFPKSTTVGQLLDNINKAEDQYKENLQKQKEEMQKNIGATYYYEDIDDRAIFTKYIIQITGVTEKYNKAGLLYTGDMIEICDNTIYYIKDATFVKEDLNEYTKMDSKYFDEAKEKYNSLKSFSVYLTIN